MADSTITAENVVAKQTDATILQITETNSPTDQQSDISLARYARLRKERAVGAIGYRFRVDSELTLWEMLDLIPREIRNGYNPDAFNLYVSALVRYVQGEKREIREAYADTNRKVNEELKWSAEDAIDEIDSFVEQAKAALTCAKHFRGKRILGGIYEELLHEFHVMHVDEECHRVRTAMNAVNNPWGKGGWLGWFERNWDDWAPQWDSSKEG
jgi:hypothetical protein